MRAGTAQWVKALAAVSEPVFNPHDPNCERREATF